MMEIHAKFEIFEILIFVTLNFAVIKKFMESQLSCHLIYLINIILNKLAHL